MEVADVLSGRRGAESVRAALGSASLRRSFRAALAGMVVEGASLDRCRLRRSKFKPDHKLTAWFDARVRPTGATRPVAVSWWASVDERGPSAGPELRAEVAARGLLEPFRSLTADVAEMRIEVAPLDPAYPALVRLSDPAYAVDRVALPGRPEVVTVRYRPGQRHVLGYHRSGSRDGPTVFAKLYSDGSARRRFEVAHAVADRIEAGDCQGARPAACLDDDDALLFGRAPGLPLTALLRGSSARGAAGLAGAGGALRRIHEAPVLPAGMHRRDVQTEVAEVDRAAAAIQLLLPEARPAVRDTLARAEDAAARLPSEPATLVHGDAKAEHFLVGPASITVIDFDKCGVGDPALDLAKVLADLRWWLLDRPAHVTGAQDQFLAGYGPAAPRLARARAFESLLFMRLVARRVTMHRPRWAERTQALVAHAGRLEERAA